MWSSLKVYLKHYRKYVAGLENEELYDVDRLLEDLQSVTRPKEIIALMREKDENSLAQSLHFMTDDNRLAQRMLIVVGNALFTTHSTRATNKLTPADNRRWRYWEVRNWQAELVTTVSDTLFDPRRLMYIGVTLRSLAKGTLISKRRWSISSASSVELLTSSSTCLACVCGNCCLEADPLRRSLQACSKTTMVAVTIV